MPGAVNISGGIPGGNWSAGRVARSSTTGAESRFGSDFSLAPLAMRFGRLPHFSKESRNGDEEAFVPPAQ
jgi:hypothetical protein